MKVMMGVLVTVSQSGFGCLFMRSAPLGEQPNLEWNILAKWHHLKVLRYAGIHRFIPRKVYVS